MAIPTPSPVLRIRLIHGAGTDLTMGSRFYIAYTDASQPSIADLNTFATFIRTTWAAQLAGQMSSSNGLQSVIVDDVANATGNQGVDSTAVSGTRAGTAPPQDEVIQLNFKIGRHYRGGKPKIYLPFGVTADYSSANTWGATFANGVVTAWNNFQAAINGHTSGGITAGAQVSVSYFQGARTNPNLSKWAKKNVAAPRTVPVVDPVVTITASRFLVTLRKRLGRP